MFHVMSYNGMVFIFVLQFLFNACVINGAEVLNGKVVGASVSINNGTMVHCKEQSWTYFRRDAPYVSLHFSYFNIINGDRITISDIDGRNTTDVTTSLRPLNAGGFTTPLIKGPNIKLTFLPTGCSKKSSLPTDFGFNISSLDYTYMIVNKENVCGYADQNQDAICLKMDVNVSDEVYEHAKAVARLMRESIAGSDVKTACTGFLIGSKGHLMTNHHCIKSQEEADATNFEFMVESKTCGENECEKLGDCQNNGKLESIGATFIHANETLDYSIVKLHKKSCGVNNPYGYLRLRKKEPKVGEKIYLVQYPNGGGKTITYRQDLDHTDTDPTTGDSGDTASVIVTINDENAYGNFWTSYYADTESGSSGTPVISRDTNTVIALHSNGACKNSGAPSHLIVEDIKRNDIDLPDDAFY